MGAGAPSRRLWGVNRSNCRESERGSFRRKTLTLSSGHLLQSVNFQKLDAKAERLADLLVTREAQNNFLQGRLYSSFNVQRMIA